MAKGEFALVHEQLSAALAMHGQPVKRGTMAHDHHLIMLLADAAAQSGDLDALRRHAPRLEELAARDDHRLYLGIAHRASAVAHRLAGETDAAATRLSQALSLFTALDARWQLARTHVELAELALARSDSAAAADQLAQAVALFEALAANPDLARARAAYAET